MPRYFDRGFYLGGCCLRRLRVIIKTKEMRKFILGDCMDLETGLPSYPDNYFDLAIVDPPYGLGDRLCDGGGHLKNTPMAALYRDGKKWDTLPPPEYFTELFRTSKNQIIWGGNYFGLPATRCLICWDKKQHMHTLSHFELAWTSFDKPTKMCRKQSTDLNRHPPTQKPVALYRWLLENYAKPGQLILDTHVGSASSLIACESMGFDYVGFEIDPDYYAAAQNRMSKGVQAVLL